MSKKIIIAIDGYSSCGKSTLAKALAKYLNYIYVDSGAMYRAVTLFFLKNNIDYHVPEKVKATLEDIIITFVYEPGNEKASTYLNGKNVENQIRSLEVSDHVSPVSAIRQVRNELVKQQQSIAEGKGIVMDGRDIGTVVFPNAELKIFMTASHEVRVTRRYNELKNKGFRVTVDEVRKNLENRDHIDSTREESPLRKADDAIILDNSDLSEKEQLEWAMNLAREKIYELS